MKTPTPPDAPIHFILPKRLCGKLADVLLCAQDEGPSGEGWASDALVELRERIGEQIGAASAEPPELIRLQSELSAALGKLAEVREWANEAYSCSGDEGTAAAWMVLEILNTQPADKGDSADGDKVRGE